MIHLQLQSIGGVLYGHARPAIRLPEYRRGNRCAVYQKEFVPGEDDLKAVNIIAAAMETEESRRRADDILRLTQFSIERADIVILWIEKKRSL